MGLLHPGAMGAAVGAQLVAAMFLDHWRQHKDDPNVTFDQLLDALSRSRT